RVAALRDREPRRSLRFVVVDVPPPDLSPGVTAPRQRLGLSRPVWLIGWVSFFTDTASEMIYPLLPLYSRVCWEDVDTGARDPLHRSPREEIRGAPRRCSSTSTRINTGRSSRSPSSPASSSSCSSWPFR